MIIVTCLFCVFTLYKFKYAVLLTASSLLFLPNLASGVGNVKLLYLVSLFQILCYCLFYREEFERKKQLQYPLLFLVPCILAAITNIISSFVGHSSNIGVVLVNILCFYVYPIIVWKVISTKKDLQLFLKCLLTFFTVVYGYALVELALGQNYYSVWANHAGIVQGILGGETSHERFGLLRCNSILPYSSALGMASAFVFYLIVLLKISHIKIMNAIYENNSSVNLILKY